MQFAFIIESGPDKNGRKARHPQEQVRQRFRVVTAGNRSYPKPYPDKAVDEAKELVALHTRLAMRDNHIRGPVSQPLEITTTFFFTRTAAQASAKIQMPFPAITPDKDNLEKLVLDGMEDVLYTNDCKVVQGGVYKRYTHREAHTVVAVRSLEDKEAMPPWDVYPHLEWIQEYYHKGW